MFSGVYFVRYLIGLVCFDYLIFVFLGYNLFFFKGFDFGFFCMGCVFEDILNNFRYNIVWICEFGEFFVVVMNIIVNVMF